MNVVSLGIIKLSVLLLYRRIFAANKRFNITSIVLCAVIILWSFSFLMAYIFECGTNLWAIWTSGATIEKYCDNEAAQTVSFCVTDAVTDLLVITAPIPLIWTLQMSFGNKLGLLAVFSLGLL